jgi:regulatory protein
LPNVTALLTSKRRSGWIDVQLDGAFACRLPTEVIQTIGLSVGDSIDPADLEKLQEEAQRQEAMRQALRYLSVRPRSRWEVERKLRDKGQGDVAVQATLERCEALGYLDDQAFAAAYSRDRIRLRPRSTKMLMAELAGKRVARPDAEAGIREALRDERVTETDLLARAADKGVRTLGSVDVEVARRRLTAYLGRRGFAGEAIREYVDGLTSDWSDGRIVEGPDLDIDEE